MNMYCVKCRAKRDVEDPEQVTMKNGKPALKAKCPVCGTGMYKIGEITSTTLQDEPLVTPEKRLEAMLDLLQLLSLRDPDRRHNLSL